MSGIWLAGVAEGEILLRNSSCCASNVPAWLKRNADFSDGVAGSAKFQAVREIEPETFP
jgi:hypothetical protein